jgi:phytoene desaturase
MKRACVIGGGLGGLACALRLAARGWRVTVLEQGERAGGKMNRWESAGFCFDTGPSLITMPHVFEETFAAAGERLSDHVTLTRLEPVARYHFADGSSLWQGTNLPAWIETLRSLDARDVDGFMRFLELGAKLFELSQATFLRRSPGEPPDIGMLKALRWFPLRGFGNYAKAVRRLFKSPKLIQMFDRYPTYVGSSPHRCPATLLVIPYLEHAFGGWFARGGLYAIVEALLRVLAKLGVEVRVKTRVRRIETRGRAVSGVSLAGGETLEAECVVMNGDASHLPALLGDAPEGSELAPHERSTSGFLLLLGLKRTLSGLAHHSVFFSRDYEREFAQLFDQRQFPDDPTVYVNAPSRSDRSLVPGEGETLFIMANAAADTEPWTPEFTGLARARVLGKLASMGLEIGPGDIAVEQLWTPADMARRYLMPGGAIYGTHSHGWRKAFLRPGNRNNRRRGLYCVGGSSHPGGGTPTVLLSAKITEGLITRDLGSPA